MLVIVYHRLLIGLELDELVHYETFLVSFVGLNFIFGPHSIENCTEITEPQLSQFLLTIFNTAASLHKSSSFGVWIKQSNQYNI